MSKPTTPAVLVAFLSRPKKVLPPWAPPGSCIITATGWTLGPTTRVDDGDDVLRRAAKEFMVDLAKPREVAQISSDFKASMPSGRGIAWTMWAWRPKAKLWLRP